MKQKARYLLDKGIGLQQSIPQAFSDSYIQRWLKNEESKLMGQNLYMWHSLPVEKHAYQFWTIREFLNREFLRIPNI